MPKLKNIRHETFAREYLATGGNGAEAYRRTWDKHPNKPFTNMDGIRAVAYSIKKRPDVTRRIEELREQMAKRSDITIDKVLTDLQIALNLAKEQLKPNDMINAAMSQAKLVGLLRDRVETGGVGDFDGIENISEILEKVAAEAGPEAALALSKAFGLAEAETTEDEEQKKAAADLLGQLPPTDSVN